MRLYRTSGSYGGLIFFFQAEDGIRDLTVTGVQTCALPICAFARTTDRRRRALRGLARECARHDVRALCPTRALRVPGRRRSRVAQRRRSATRDRKSVV